MSPFVREPRASRKPRKLICWLLTRFVILSPGCCECECVFIASKHSHLIAFRVKAGLHHGLEAAITTFSTLISAVIAVLEGMFDWQCLTIARSKCYSDNIRLANKCQIFRLETLAFFLMSKSNHLSN
jgi:hypothetical protein